MDTYTLLFIGTILVGIIGYFVRAEMQRLDELEKQMPFKITDSEARQLLEDKINPLKESIVDMKVAVDKVYDLLIRKAND